MSYGLIWNAKFGGLARACNFDDTLVLHLLKLTALAENHYSFSIVKQTRKTTVQVVRLDVFSFENLFNLFNLFWAGCELIVEKQHAVGVHRLMEMNLLRSVSWKFVDFTLSIIAEYFSRFFKTQNTFGLCYEEAAKNHCDFLFLFNVHRRRQ